MEKYNLTLNKEQLLIIAEALDVCGRIKCAQLKEFHHLFDDKKYNKDKVAEYLCDIKENIFPELQNTEYLSIYGRKAPTEAKLAYDIYKTILHQLHKDDESWSINRDEHLLLAGKYGIKIEKI